MKTKNLLLPLACGISALTAHVAPAFAQGEQMRVEPVMSVRHSAPDVDAWYSLGRHHQQANRLDLAADAYRRVLASQSGHVEARNALAVVYSLQDKFDEAIGEFQALLQDNPALAHVHNNLGYTYYLQSQYRKAVASFGNAIALEPGNARAFGNLALAYSRLPAAEAAAGDAGRAAPGATASTAATQDAVASSPAAEPAPQAAALSTVADTSSDAASPAAERGLPSLNGITIEIANGTRNTRLAQDLATALRAEGAIVARVAELKPYTQRRNVILYRDGYYKQALALSKRFTVPPAVVNNTRRRAASDKSTVRLVIGRAALPAAAAAADKTGTPAS